MPRTVDEVLSDRYDALNQTFVEAEQILRSLRSPHAVWVRCNNEGEQELLGLAKHRGRWMICHAVGDEFSDVKPITECSISVRVRAAHVVKDLYEKIVKTKEEYIPQVDEAIQELVSFCNQAKE